MLIFLGDYVDRGPDSLKVVRRLRMIEGPSVICLRGNHEQMMVECEEGLELWRDNGGAETKSAHNGQEDQFEDDRVWMSRLPTSFEDELRIFVHAGIKLGQPLAGQTDHTKLWIRGGFLRFKGAFPKYEVHGHTPTSLFQMECQSSLRTGATSIPGLYMVGGSQPHSSTTNKQRLST
jgi:serine/threonine protein phosphatase 1